jgi:hypothetical protein
VTWHTSYTARGFPQHEFRDRYGRGVVLRESSLATEPCIWIFPEHHVAPDGSDLSGAHLTVDAARDVAQRLLAWAEGAEPASEERR